MVKMTVAVTSTAEARRPHRPTGRTPRNGAQELALLRSNSPNTSVFRKPFQVIRRFCGKRA